MFLPTDAQAQACGGIFVDNGGTTGNYSNNLNQYTTICPSNPGDMVTVTFTSFDLENGNDILKVYDGNSPSSTLIGYLTGSTIPQPITSSSPDGCLTFNFTSNSTITSPGWIANVTCAPRCYSSAYLTVSNITDTDAQLNVTDILPNSQWEIVVLPAGAPAPYWNSVGTIINSNSYTVTGLYPNTCYDSYVRSICSSTSSSTWVGPVTFCTGNCYNTAICPDRIDLIAFLDSNNNGIKDIGESSFNNGSFAFDMNNSGTNSYGYSNSGLFTIYDTNPTDTFTISFALNPGYSTTYCNSSTTYSNLTIPIGSGASTYYFPITLLATYNDLEVAITPFSGCPQPGFIYRNNITYKNNGLQSIPSGTITFYNYPLVAITNISQSGTTPTSTGFTYNFNNLMPNEERSFFVDMQVPSLPTVNIGDVLTNSVSADPIVGDAFPFDNSADLFQVVGGSYDPNELTEAHGGKIVLNSFTSNDYLNYTIQFENTGATNASFIRIEDLLDASLDPSSIIMLNSSHNYNMRRIGNKLIFNFSSINLPPNSVNPTSSHGYIQFKIKPTAGYAIGTIIPNKADIYFDYNPAIVTNTFNTEFVAALNTNSFASNGFVIYPNPAQKTLQLQTKTNTTIDKIIITDLSGKIILEQTQNTNQINIEHLWVGMYFIEAFSGDEKYTSKFVKE